jgi:hypothetical protein
MTQVIAEIRSHDELIVALRARKASLGLSNEVLEHLIPLAAGHCDKLLGPSQERGLSRSSLDGMLAALGLQLIVAIDPVQSARMQSRWEGKDTKQVRPQARIGAGLIKKVRPAVLRQLASKAATARWSRTTPETRRAVMRRVWTARRNVKVQALQSADVAVDPAR